MNFDVTSRIIYKCVHGSRAYGTHTENSDWDYKGILIPPKEIILGFIHTFEQQESMQSKDGDCDQVIYSLQKFCKLAADNNPNIIEILFCDDSDVQFIDEFGQKLRDRRYEFLSKRAKHTFSGYAISQLKRIKTHRNWLLNPPQKEPSRKEFHLPETMKISRSELGAYDALIDQQGKLELAENIVQLFCAEKAYQAAKLQWDQYQNWKNTRNKNRASLEEKFGFDTKHAYHLIRLMRMCKEILEDGKVIVKRPDAQDLLQIRNGLWTYDEVIQEAECLEKICESLYETSKLRKEPNRTKLNQFIVELMDEYLTKHG
jgi:predicted nucleotidyltransferase